MDGSGSGAYPVEGCTASDGREMKLDSQLLKQVISYYFNFPPISFLNIPLSIFFNCK